MGCGEAILQTWPLIRLESKYISEMKPNGLTTPCFNTGQNGQMTFLPHNSQYSPNFAERFVLRRYKAVTVSKRTCKKF